MLRLAVVEEEGEVLVWERNGKLAGQSGITLRRKFDIKTCYPDGFEIWREDMFTFFLCLPANLRYTLGREGGPGRPVAVWDSKPRS